MSYRLHLVFVFAIFFAVNGCSTSQVAAPVPAPEPQIAPAHLAVAERFLHNIGAGEVAMAAFQKEKTLIAREQPGLAELGARAFADVGIEEVEEIVAEVYARHLSQTDLTELARFSERPAIKRFFRIVFEMHSSGEELDNEALMARFDADELTEIFQFAYSDSHMKMVKVLPEINRELAVAGEEFGESLLLDYLGRQPVY